MRLTFASYNIHKAVGIDGRYDPERIMAVLREIDADVIALQEADRRFGSREAVLPRSLLDDHHWQVVPAAIRPGSMGWHGNAMLVREGIDIVDVKRIAIPSLEPRGALYTHLSKDGFDFCAGGMHLDLSGILRRNQIAAVCRAMDATPPPSVVMGDMNEWSRLRGALRAFGPDWTVLAPGGSFPSRRPFAMLDRIAHTPGWRCDRLHVHHSFLAARASDHLPVYAALEFTA